MWRNINQAAINNVFWVKKVRVMALKCVSGFTCRPGQDTERSLSPSLPQESKAVLSSSRKYSHVITGSIFTCLHWEKYLKCLNP